MEKNMDATVETKLVATFSEGVFKPDQPVELPENSRVELVLKSVVADDGTRPGSPVGGNFGEYIKHLKAVEYHFGNRWNRDSLYDRV